MIMYHENISENKICRKTDQDSENAPITKNDNDPSPASGPSLLLVVYYVDNNMIYFHF